MPIEEGVITAPEQKVVTGLRPGDWGNWAPANEGVYYIPQPQNGVAVIQYKKFTAGSVRTVCVLRKPPIYGSAGLGLSPDGRLLLFAQVDQDDSNLFIQ
jgi:hypothetical protein